MAIIVKVISKPDKNFRQKQQKFILNIAERHTRELAEQTERVIRNNIKQDIKRAGSTGHLASSFFLEKIQNGYGVGNIDFLNKFAPYWRHQNFGSRLIGAKWEHWVPSGAFQPGGSRPGDGTGQRWEEGSGPYAFFPSNPLPSKNYVEKTLAEMFNRVPSIIGKI